MALEIGVQLVKSLRDLHGLGYIHRDIKPNNILVKSDEAFKNEVIDICLIDYGYAEKFMNDDGSHIEV